MCFSCNRRVVVYEQPVVEDVTEVNGIFPDEDIPIAPDCAAREFKAVYFGFDGAVVSKDGLATIDRLAGYLRGCDGVVVEVGGHCDERGDAGYNFGLGQRRADAVRGVLVGMGIAGDRVKVLSFGEGGLVATGCENEDCHALNRRVEFKLERSNK